MVFEVSNCPWGNMVSLIAAILVTGGIYMSRSCWLFSVVSVSAMCLPLKLLLFCVYLYLGQWDNNNKRTRFKGWFWCFRFLDGCVGFDQALYR